MTRPAPDNLKAVVNDFERVLDALLSEEVDLEARVVAAAMLIVAAEIRDLRLELP